MQNKPAKKSNKAKWILKRIFVEHWFIKFGAILCGIMLWLCVGYLF